MKISSTVESALHTCVVLATVPRRATISVKRLAEFHDLAPASLAKQLQSLTAADIVEGSTGRVGGYRLKRPATGITILEIVLAIDGSDRGFRCTEIRRDGPCSGPNRDYSPTCAIAQVMHEAEQAWRSSLGERTLADVCRSIAGQLDPQISLDARVWITEHQRTAK